MNSQSFLVPKSIWKSKTFLITILVVIILVVFQVLSLSGVKVDGWIGLLLTGLAGVFIGGEKVKDGKEAAANILINATGKDIMKLGKPIVNEEASKWLIGLGLLINSFFGVLSKQNGVHIDPWILASVNSVIGTFVGFDKYKAAKILVAKNMVEGKKKVK